MLSKKLSNRPIVYVLIVIVCFIVCIVSLAPIEISVMGTDQFFIEQIIPIPYWIGLAILLLIIFFLMNLLDNQSYRTVFLFSAIILIICIRMVFTITFTNIIDFEPDSSIYINVVNDWVNNELNFGEPGYYQHDYPLSFIVAFFFVKLGVPIDLYFRVSPLIIYALDLIFLYLIVDKIFFKQRQLAPLSAFLLALSSLAGWITVHYCPDLFGTLFYFIALYFTINFAIEGVWRIKFLLPVILSVLLLILSHHLSTLFFIFTTIGLAISCWFFKPYLIKGNFVAFLSVAILTYTSWFIYGNAIYPDFFSVHKYFTGFGSAVVQAQQAPLLVNFTFAFYPLFIILFSIYAFKNLLDINKLRLLTKIFIKLKEKKGENSLMLLVYPFGFVLIGFLVLISFGIPVIQAPRLLEVFFIGLYPLSSYAILKLLNNGNSKKNKIILFLIFILILITTIHRYYSAIQRRVLFA